MNAVLAALVLPFVIALGLPLEAEYPSDDQTQRSCKHPSHPAINAAHKGWVKRLYKQPYLPTKAVNKHTRMYKCAPSKAQRDAIAKRWRIVKHPTKGVAVPNYQTWINVGRCEQPGPGRWGVWWSHTGGTYSGGLGFYNQSWLAFRLAGYPSNAGDASWRQQMHTANNLWWSVGWGWGCGG